MEHKNTKSMHHKVEHVIQAAVRLRPTASDLALPPSIPDEVRRQLLEFEANFGGTRLTLFRNAHVDLGLLWGGELLWGELEPDEPREENLLLIAMTDEVESTWCSSKTGYVSSLELEGGPDQFSAKKPADWLSKLVAFHLTEQCSASFSGFELRGTGTQFDRLINVWPEVDVIQSDEFSSFFASPTVCGVRRHSRSHLVFSSDESAFALLTRAKELISDYEMVFSYGTYSADAGIFQAAMTLPSVDTVNLAHAGSLLEFRGDGQMWAAIQQITRKQVVDVRVASSLGRFKGTLDAAR